MSAILYEATVMSNQPDSNGWAIDRAALRKTVETFPPDGTPLHWSFLSEGDEGDAGRVIGLALATDEKSVKALVYSDFFGVSGKHVAASFSIRGLPPLGGNIFILPPIYYALTQTPSDPAATPLVRAERAVTINLQGQWGLKHGLAWEIRDFQTQALLENVFLTKNSEGDYRLTGRGIVVPVIGITNDSIGTVADWLVVDRAVRALVANRGYLLVGRVPPNDD